MNGLSWAFVPHRPLGKEGPSCLVSLLILLRHSAITCFHSQDIMCFRAGYWDENENLDRELSLFVAGMWTCLHSPGSDEPYFYNQVRYTDTKCAA